MKNTRITLLSSGLALLFMLNACQSPEERAKEMNKSANADTLSMVTDSTANTNTNNAATNDTVSSTTQNTTAKKTAKGKASIDLSETSTGNGNGKMEKDKEGVYNRSEIMPSYPGGEAALEQFVQNNLQYPQQALDNGVEGRVVVSFDVDEAGKIYRPMIVSKKIGYGLEEEALQVVKEMPQWNPGKIKGKNVKTKFTLPISYQLEQ